MSVDYTYLEVQPQFSPKAIEAGTGLGVTPSGVLASPRQAQIVTYPDPLDEKQLLILDQYFLDQGYVRNQ